MKKILIMFTIALICVTVFNGCNKDNNSIEPQNQIVGKWKATSYNQTLNGNPIEDTILDVAAEQMVMEFNSNLSYTFKKKNVLAETGTYTISGGTLNTKITGENDYSMFTFTISNGILHVYNQHIENEIDTYIFESIWVRIP